MKRYCAAVLSVIFSVLSAFPVYAYKSDRHFEQTLLPENKQVYMTGEWGGTRDEIANEGVTFTSTFVCDVLGDVSGGMHQAGRFDSSTGWDINFDLEKLANIIGAQFHISGLWRTGNNLSKDIVGNVLVTSSIYGSEQFRFYEMFLEKTFLDNRVNARIGRIATGDDFGFSPLYWTYVSNSVDGCPISLPLNMFFPVYPTAVWGARIKANLSDDIYLTSGIYNADKEVGRQAAAGLDFSLRLSRGMAFAQEIAYAPNTSPDSKGMPGHYKAGIYYNGSTCRDLYSDINGAAYSITGLAQKKHIGNYNVYLHADQAVYHEEGTEDQGLTALAVTTIGPENINIYPFFIMSGLIYKGLIPERDEDLSAFEVVYIKWSDDIKRSQSNAGLTTQKYELMLEFTHKFMITKWMFLQPDLQYIIQPGGTGDIKDALVIGTRFGLTF
ncbi:MAG: carbohydrate porin [Candidatus Omnitrophica bacterium]|nr:carbohydrate porin [Candidatus Omnitrophota bacterium]